jgi:hypothetical protein
MYNRLGRESNSKVLAEGLATEEFRSMRFRGVLLSIALAAGSVAPGQTAKPQQEPRYDPATVIEASATVTDLRETPRGGPLAGVHLTVRTDKETLDAYVSPSDFLKDIGLSFAKGERIQIVGSKVKFGDGSVVLLRELSKQGSTLYLRDKNGTPNWPNPEKGGT